VSEAPLNPSALLAVLAENGVDFVVVGALAVGAYADVRATGDVDVMVPAGDKANKRALQRALEQLGAERLPSHQGGVEPASDDPYPMMMFRTRYGKLDILYRPDGSDSYPKVKQRSVSATVSGQRVAVAGKNDLVRMKLAAGRPDDLRDVANLTAAEHGQPRQIFVSMTLAPDADHDWARDLTAARVAYFDPDSRIWIAEDKHLQIEATRSGLTDRQLEQWARALADRLLGAEVVADTDIDVEISAA
jgi:hypothetical protein